MHNFINNKQSKILIIVICILVVPNISNCMFLAPYQQGYRGKQSTKTMTVKTAKAFRQQLPHHITMHIPQETIPQEIVNISSTLKNAQENTEEYNIVNKLGYPQSIINDTFLLLLLQLHKDSSLQQKIDLLALDQLVPITNFVEILEITSTPNLIMDLLIESIALLIDNMTNKFYKDLSSFNTSIQQHYYSANIILPYYEPLKRLNPEVEKKMKNLYATGSLLFSHIENIWNLLGINTQNLEQEKKLFKNNHEPLAHFLNRNIKMIALSYIHQKLYQNGNSQFYSILH